jgi:hypothetical protein
MSNTKRVTANAAVDQSNSRPGKSIAHLDQ